MNGFDRDDFLGYHTFIYTIGAQKIRRNTSNNISYIISKNMIKFY